MERRPVVCEGKRDGGGGSRDLEDAGVQACHLETPLPGLPETKGGYNVLDWIVWLVIISL